MNLGTRVQFILGGVPHTGFVCDPYGGVLNTRTCEVHYPGAMVPVGEECVIGDFIITLRGPCVKIVGTTQGGWSVLDTETDETSEIPRKSHWIASIDHEFSDPSFMALVMTGSTVTARQKIAGLLREVVENARAALRREERERP